MRKTYEITPAIRGKLVTLALLLFFSNCKQDILHLSPEQYQWHTRQSGESVPSNNWKVYSGAYADRSNAAMLWVRYTIPQSIPDDAAILVQRPMEIMEVYLHNKMIYATGNIDKANGPAFIGYYSSLIPLPQATGGDTLYIRYYSNSKFLIGTSKPVRFSSYHKLVLWSLEEGAGAIITGFFNIIISLIIFFAFFYFKNNTFISFGLLNLFLGIYFLVYALPSLLFFKYPLATAYLWELSIIFASFAFKNYFELLFGKTKSLQLWQEYFIYFLIFKYTFNPIPHINTWTLILNLFLVGNLLVILATSAINSHKKKQGAFAYLLVMIFISGIGINNAFADNLQHASSTQLHFGLLLFIIANGYIGIQKHYLLQQETNRLAMEKEQNLKEILELELQQFSEKINPGFFNNTLKYIYNNILAQPEKCDDLIRLLADNYRYVTEFSRKNTVSLDNELKFLNLHLRINHIVSAGTFSYSIKSRGNILVASILPLSLQSMVDSIYLEDPDPGTLFLELQILYRNKKISISIRMNRNMKHFHKSLTLLDQFKKRFELYFTDTVINIKYPAANQTEILVQYTTGN